MKKAQWLKKPEKFLKIDLHTVSFMNGTSSRVFFTLGESGTLSLSGKSTYSSFSFIFFHTPNDYIIFKDNTIESLFFGLESKHNMLISITQIEIIKNGEEITFSSGETELLKIKNSAFFSSASFGIVTEGRGEAEISVW